MSCQGDTPAHFPEYPQGMNGERDRQLSVSLQPTSPHTQDHLITYFLHRAVVHWGKKEINPLSCFLPVFKPFWPVSAGTLARTVCVEKCGGAGPGRQPRSSPAYKPCSSRPQAQFHLVLKSFRLIQESASLRQAHLGAALGEEGLWTYSVSWLTLALLFPEVPLAALSQPCFHHASPLLGFVSLLIFSPPSHLPPMLRAGASRSNNSDPTA